MTAPTQAIHIHAGTHCATAEAFSTYLGANADAIARAGWDLALCDSDNGAATAKALAAAQGGGQGLLVSDATLPGTARVLLEGRFYPDARARARALAQALGRPIARLVLVVQPYDAVFQRAWQGAEHPRGMRLADLAPQLAGFDGGWHDVVADLQEGLGARRVTVLAAPQEPQAILNHLVPGLASTGLRGPGTLPQMTATARATLERIRAQGLRLAPGQRERLMAFHARLRQTGAEIVQSMADAAEPAFSGLTLADLRGRYIADLDSLSRLPGVNVIGGFAADRPRLAAE